MHIVVIVVIILIIRRINEHKPTPIDFGHEFSDFLSDLSFFGNLSFNLRYVSLEKGKFDL